MNKSNKEQLSYVEQLEAKGIHCSQHQTCHGCVAFSPYSEERLQEWGWSITFQKLKELHEKEICSACDLGFLQTWINEKTLSPKEPCPKEKIERLYFKCIEKID